MTLEMKGYQELGFDTAQVDPVQGLRKDVNWAMKRTLAVDKVSSGVLIRLLKKSAIVLAGKTTKGREDVAVVLPQISTNNQERADEVRVAALAIQREAIHKAAVQGIITPEAAEEKLQRIDDGIEPRPRIIFQKTSGLMKERSKNARFLSEESPNQSRGRGSHSETTPANVWQIPAEAKAAKRIKRRNVIMAATIPFIAAGCSKVAMTPTPAENVSTENLPPPSITTIPRAKEKQIMPSPTQESMENILLSSVEVMTKEEIESNLLLSDPNFQEGISNYVQKTREIKGLSDKSTAFELVVIKGTKDNGDEIYFPFTAWTAQNEEGSNLLEMVGVSESGLAMITLEHQEIEKDGVLHYARVLQDVGPIFAVPASEIDNPDAEISFSPSGKALETTEHKIGAEVLSLLKPEVKIAGLTQNEIAELNSQLEFRYIENKGLSGICEITDEPTLSSMEFISSGIFDNSDLFNINTGEVIGEITTLTVVSRDEDGSPITLRVIVQAELFSVPNVNQFPLINTVLLVIGGLSYDDERVKGNYELTGLDEWEKRMPSGSMWTFEFPRNPAPDSFVNSTHYTSSEYNKSLSDFFKSGGIIIPDDLIVVPIAVSTRW